MRNQVLALLLLVFSCASDGGAQDRIPGTNWPACADVPDDFVLHVRDVLKDTAGMFRGDYPEATPFTCELLLGLREAMNDDSVRYQFEHLSQRYRAVDPHYHRVERFIKRHMSFHLSIAASGHFFGDIRIMGLRELYEYRRSRPLVCATRDHYALLEEQDRQAVRYLLQVLETTPLMVQGSENATIHSAYISWVLRTLDLFTGQQHFSQAPGQLIVAYTEKTVQEALPEWRKWLER